MTYQDYKQFPLFFTTHVLHVLYPQQKYYCISHNEIIIRYTRQRSSE